MKLHDKISQFGQLVHEAQTILVLQPEKPDSDSLCSTLALEHILGDLGKDVIMYTRDDVPPYLNYFEGVDRLVEVWPAKYDLTIIVDFGSPNQLGRTLEKYQAKIAAKPVVVLDHHANRTSLEFDSFEVVDVTSASTGELLYKICQQLGWGINSEAAALIVPSIMADTLGLSVPTTTADTIQTVAEMVRLGADMYAINQARLQAGALTPELLHLRGQLLSQVEFHHEGRVALLTVSPEVLKQYAKAHDPSDLVVYDMQRTKGVELAIVIRNYAPKIKVSMRANSPVAARLAQEFGGGGHPQAAGITIEAGDAGELRAQLLEKVEPMLTAIEAEQINEAV